MVLQEQQFFARVAVFFADAKKPGPAILQRRQAKLAAGCPARQPRSLARDLEW